MEYLTWGTGPETLLYVQGGPGSVAPKGGMSLRMFRRMLDPYAKAGYAVWIVTRRRHMPAGHTIAGMADDYTQLIRQEFGARVDLVVGESYGGLIGQYLAAFHPGSFGHIALVVAGLAEAPGWVADVDSRFGAALARGDVAGAGTVAVGEYLLRAKPVRWASRESSLHPSEGWGPLATVLGRCPLSGNERAARSFDRREVAGEHARRTLRAEEGAMSGPASVRASARKRRRVGVIVGVAIAVAAAGALVLGLVVVGGVTRQVPQFPSLAEHPDPLLQGTVAYYNEQNPQCVKVVAAAGRPVKTLCLQWPAPELAKEGKEGKPVGPQLVWLRGGRLQVTMFRMTPPAKPGAVPALHRGWQKIIDVRTGTVQDVPAAEVPSQPDRSSQRMVSSGGQRISWTSHDGRIKVMLTGRNGTRALLSAQGPGEYTYGLYSAFWAPNWQWIAAEDGRILIITTGRPPLTRVLSTKSRPRSTLGFAPALAVTAENILTPSR